MRIRNEASAFVGMSVDGFIARAAGDREWLPHGEGGDHGYGAFNRCAGRQAAGATP